MKDVYELAIEAADVDSIRTALLRVLVDVANSVANTGASVSLMINGESVDEIANPAAQIPADTHELLTPDEVAQWRRTSVRFLVQERYRGTGPRFVKSGRRVLYRRSDVEEWLSGQTIEPLREPRVADAG